MSKESRDRKGKFKKGIPGGPGRPKLDEFLKKARKLNQTEFITLLNDFICWTEEDLIRVTHNKHAPAFHKIVCMMIIKGIQSGELAHLNFILDRLIGKVKEHVDIVSTNYTSVATLGEDKISEIIKKLKADV